MKREKWNIAFRNRSKAVQIALYNYSYFRSLLSTPLKVIISTPFTTRMIAFFTLLLTVVPRKLVRNSFEN